MVGVGTFAGPFYQPTTNTPTASPHLFTTTARIQPSIRHPWPTLSATSSPASTVSPIDCVRQQPPITTSLSSPPSPKPYPHGPNCEQQITVSVRHCPIRSRTSAIPWCFTDCTLSTSPRLQAKNSNSQLATCKATVSLASSNICCTTEDMLKIVGQQ